MQFGKNKDTLGKDFIRKIGAAALSICLGIGIVFTPTIESSAAHSISENSFTDIQDTIIRFSPQVSAQEAYWNTNCYLQLPSNVLERMKNDGVVIYLIAKDDELLTTSKLTSASGRKYRLAGLTTHPQFRVYYEKSTGAITKVQRISNGVIEIQTDANYATALDPYRVVHEIAHYVDTATGSASGTYFSISKSEEWQNFYNLYRDQILQYSAYASAPNLYDASECWADAFKLAYSQPEILQEISPDLLQYVAQKTMELPTIGGEQQ